MPLGAIVMHCGTTFVMPLGCGITTLIFEVCILNALGDHHFNSLVGFNVS
jgi:hypothetical protein